MDVESTPEERMLRDATRSFLEARIPRSRVRALASTASGFDVNDWVQAASLGWFGLLAPEEHGGAGLGAPGVVPAAIVAEELGRALTPGPFLPVTVVADALARVGTPSQQRAHLPGLIAGTAVATWAIADGNDAWSSARASRNGTAGTTGTVATRSGDGYVVSGVKRWVVDAANATQLLVTCRLDDGLVQVLVPLPAPGLRISPLATMDLGRRIADVELDGVEVDLDAVLGDPGDAAAHVDHQLQLAVVLQCAETVGAASAMLEKAVVYAKQRYAFGRPIGSFQAIKHHVAEAVTALEAAQAATWGAARSLACDAPDRARMAHIAKAFVGRACPTIVETCMQVHGGIGMTWEDDSHLFLRRVQSNRMLFGSPSWHADRLCGVVGVAA